MSDPYELPTRELFDAARNEVTDFGFFTDDQSYRLRQMINLLEIAVNKKGK